MSAPLETVRAALEALGCGPKQSGGNIIARCPAHEDGRASLSASEGSDGRALLKCHAGCETTAITRALGLGMRDLFPPKGSASGLGPIVATYDYTDEKGATLYEKVRFEPKTFRLRRPDPTARDGYAPGLGGARRVLYRLPALLAAIRDGAPIFIVEGEKDADNLARLGLAATTDDAGASRDSQRQKWRREHTDTLAGAPRVVILPDKDEPGRARGRFIAEQLAGRVPDLRVVELPGAGKDVSDWISAGGTREEMERLVQAAPQWRASSPAEVALESAENDPSGPVSPMLERLWRPLPAEWLTEVPPRREYLFGWRSAETGDLHGALPRGKVGLLAAPGASGKSWILVQLAFAAATGADWMGFAMMATGRVLLVLGEEDEEEAQRRVYYAGVAMDLTPEQRRLARERMVVMALAGKNLALTNEQDGSAAGLPETEFCRALRHKLESEGPWALVVLDPLSRFAGPDVEVDNSAATRFVQVLESFQQLPGTPTVLVSHHTGKGSRREGQSTATDSAAATAARGASALTDGVRWQANLEVLKRVEGAPELSVLRVVKSNCARPTPDTYLVADLERHGARRPATAAEVAAHGEAVDGIRTAQSDQRKDRAHKALVNAVVGALEGADKPLSIDQIRVRVRGAKGAVASAVTDAADQGRIEQVFNKSKPAGWTVPRGCGPMRTDADGPHQSLGTDSPLIGSPVRTVRPAPEAASPSPHLPGAA